MDGGLIESRVFDRLVLIWWDSVNCTEASQHRMVGLVC